MPSVGEFEITVDGLPDEGVLVRVSGELDMATSPQLETALNGIGRGKRLIVDLTECTFLDSSAVRVLHSLVRKTEESGGTISLVASDSGLRRVLEIAALDTMLAIHESVDAALGPS